MDIFASAEIAGKTQVPRTAFTSCPNTLVASSLVIHVCGTESNDYSLAFQETFHNKRALANGFCMPLSGQCSMNVVPPHQLDQGKSSFTTNLQR